MVDESTGEKYASAVEKKVIGEENEMEWLVKDMSEEMKSWGRQGGDEGHIILKSDGERSIVALRTALAKVHGGKVVPEDPLRGESQSNGTVEEAGKTVREFVRVRREHVQDKAEVELGASDVIVLWMVRWAAMMVSRFLVGKDGLTACEWQKMQDPGRSARMCGTRRSGQARSAPTSWRASDARGFGWDTAAGRMRPSSGRVKVWSEPTLSSAWVRRAAWTPSISR